MNKIADKILSNELIPLTIPDKNGFKDIFIKINKELRLDRWRKYWPIEEQ